MEDKNKFELLKGNERFILHGKELDLKICDFWSFQFSNLIDNLGYVAEFLVAKALGKDFPDNCDGWTPYDIYYNRTRIEVKATSYYQSWKKENEVSEKRNFSIRKTNNSETNEIARQNDIYVFCVDEGRDVLSANPLNLDNWTFYVVPTSVINEKCGDQKTISLQKITQLDNYRKKLSFEGIKDAIDFIIFNKNKT